MKFWPETQMKFSGKNRTVDHYFKGSNPGAEKKKKTKCSLSIQTVATDLFPFIELL